MPKVASLILLGSADFLLDCFSLQKWQKTGSFRGANVQRVGAHEESYFRVRERSKMSAADCTKYGGQHGTRVALTCDLLIPTVVFAAAQN